MLKTAKAAILVLGLILICGTWSNARADEWNKKTVVTFPDSVEVPNMVLPAGTYVFKLAESPSNRNIVQIWSADESKLLTTFIAVPNYRLQPAGKTIINFSERPSGASEAVREWFYPGDNFGQEFVYPKSRATELAATNKESVLEVSSYNTQSPSSETDLNAMRNQSVMAVTPTATEVQPESSTPQTTDTNTQQAATPQPTTPAPDTPSTTAPQAQTQEGTSELPKTASSLGLIVLLGGFSLAVAFALRLVLKHMA